jgi:hypothetical protein
MRNLHEIRTISLTKRQEAILNWLLNIGHFEVKRENGKFYFKHPQWNLTWEVIKFQTPGWNYHVQEWEGTGRTSDLSKIIIIS